MKTKKSIFHGRLYLEGLKRLRVLGFGLLAIALAVSILVPVTYIISNANATYDYYDSYSINDWSPPQMTLQWDSICYSTLLFPFASPIFILVAFSFLFKRRESDLYHSIPYTRTCLYVSFVAAAMTWVWGITLLCSTVSGILWSLAPNVILPMADLFLLLRTSLLSSALLCGFMLLAVSLCGNLATTLLNFFLFMILPRLTLCLLGFTLEAGMPLTHLWYFCNGFFSTAWCLPLGLVSIIESRVDVTYTPMLVYSAAAALLLFVFAGICFAKRRSEMAGSSAQSRRMQHLFRCLFTLPFVFFTVFILLTETFEPALFLVLITVILLVYYLYELITTKRFRNLWNATPYLLAVLAGGLLFAGCYGAIYTTVLNREIDPADVEEVEFEVFGNSFMPESSYEYIYFKNSPAMKDPEVIAEFTQCLRQTQSAFRRESYHGQNASIVTFKLKNGTEISRMIATNGFSEFDALIRLRLEPLPSASEITRIGMHDDGENYVSVYLINKEQIIDFISVFEAEYESLTVQQKGMVKIELSSNALYGFDKLIRIDGTTADGKYFSSFYRVIDEMEKSHAWIEEYFNSVNQQTETVVD